MTRSSAHPSGEELRRFLLAVDSPEESQRTGEHLLDGCAWCLRRLHRWAGAARDQERQGFAGLRKGEVAGGGRSREERLVEIARRRILVVEAERAAAPSLLHELRLLSPENRRKAIRGGERFRFLGVAELLTKEARQACFHDVAQALELAKLAAEVADTLDRNAYPPGLGTDAVALARAAEGNSQRVLGDLREAERALDVARGLVARGSQDPGVRAEILSLVGSLRIDEARFDEAVEVLEEAARIYRAYGDPGAEAKVLMQLGNASGERGETEEAVGFLIAARERLGDDAPGELDLIAAQSLLGWLVAGGRVEEARAVLEGIEVPAKGREMSFYLRQRVGWATARLLWAEGDRERAETKLRQVREAYREADEIYRMCLLSLDLALLFLEEGRTSEVRQLAEEMLPVFASLELHHNALQALAIFQRAAETETATAALVQDLARYLRQSAKNPYLPYEPTPEP